MGNFEQGAATEILGGLIYPAQGKPSSPMYINDSSSFAVFHRDGGYPVFAREIRAGTTRDVNPGFPRGSFYVSNADKVGADAKALCNGEAEGGVPPMGTDDGGGTSVGGSGVGGQGGASGGSAAGGGASNSGSGGASGAGGGTTSGGGRPSGGNGGTSRGKGDSSTSDLGAAGDSDGGCGCRLTARQRDGNGHGTRASGALLLLAATVPFARRLRYKGPSRRHHRASR